MDLCLIIKVYGQHLLLRLLARRSGKQAAVRLDRHTLYRGPVNGSPIRALDLQGMVHFFQTFLCDLREQGRKAPPGALLVLDHRRKRPVGPQKASRFIGDAVRQLHGSHQVLLALVKIRGKAHKPCQDPLFSIPEEDPRAERIQDRKHGHDHAGFAGNQAHRPIGAEDQDRKYHGPLHVFLQHIPDLFILFHAFLLFPGPCGPWQNNNAKFLICSSLYHIPPCL